MAVQQPRAGVVSNEVSGADDGGEHANTVHVSAADVQHVAVEVNAVDVDLVSLRTLRAIRSVHCSR